MWSISSGRVGAELDENKKAKGNDDNTVFGFKMMRVSWTMCLPCFPLKIWSALLGERISTNRRRYVWYVHNQSVLQLSQQQWMEQAAAGVPDIPENVELLEQM